MVNIELETRIAVDIDKTEMIVFTPLQISNSDSIKVIGRYGGEWWWWPITCSQMRF